MSVEELRLQKEKCRVFELARELNKSSKELLDLCHEAGIDVKNQLSGLDRAQIEQIEQLVRRGGGGVAVAAPPRSASPPVLPRDISTKVRTLPPARTAQTPPPARPPAAAPTPPPAPTPVTQAPPAPAQPVESP